MAGSYDFFKMLQAVENYYGSGSDQWLAMAQGTATAAEKAAILKSVPGVSTTITESGELLSWSLGVDESVLTTAQAAASGSAAVINSNAVSAGSQTLLMEVPGNAKIAQGALEVTSGATKVGAAGTGTATLECVLGHAATWLLGAGIGMKLGVWLDAGLYNLAPDFWDENNLLFVDPERFKENIVTNWILEQSGYPVAPVLADNEGQFYCNEELFAYFAKYMALQGFFETEREEASQGDLPDEKFYYPNKLTAISYTTANEINFKWSGTQGTQTFNIVSDGTVYSALLGTPAGVPYPEYFGSAMLVCVSESPFEVNGHSVVTTTTMKDGTGLYVYVPYGPIAAADMRITESDIPVNLMNVNSEPNEFLRFDIPYMLIHGLHTEIHQREGVHTYDDMPVISPEMSVDDVLNYLKTQFPDLFQDRSRVGTLNDDGTVTDRYYIPFNIPSGGTDKQPETRPTDKPKLNPTDDPDADPDTDPQLKNAIKTVQPPSDPTVPDVPGTGTGTTPPYVAPTGTADALYEIYNPTAAQVRALGAWLWSSNFVDQLLKMFNNPMDAIISLHKIYGTPHTGGTQNIKVGYLDSGVSSKVVDEQYIHIDCGTVNLYERYANVFDYAPYTEINLYLPFVGIVPVDVADVMRGRVNVVYHIDVITGAVLVEVKIVRDGSAGGVIYQYTGSCAEHYPLSSGSYMGIVTGAAGIVGGIAATIATGGATAPMLLGAAAGIGGMHANIQRSSSFTANAGAMGIKKPYFIISRPQTAMAQNYGHYVGRGANTLVLLSNLKGYCKVKEIYLVNGNTGMTDAEQTKIKSLLKEGVVV